MLSRTRYLTTQVSIKFEKAYGKVKFFHNTLWKTFVQNNIDK